MIKGVKVILLLLMGMPIFAFSQNSLGLKIQQVKPYGIKYGSVYNPTIGFQLIWNFSYIEDQLQSSIIIGHYKLQPYTDTLYTFDYGIEQTVFSDYKSTCFGLSTDFRLLKNFDLSPVIGFDYLIERAKVIAATSEYYDSRLFVFSFVPKVEIMYNIQDIMAVSVGVGRSFRYTESYSNYEDFNSYWDTYVKYKYYLD